MSLMTSTSDVDTGWHLITGEYPPEHGGVSDYTEQVAARLSAEGCQVHVWCRGDDLTPTTGSAGPTLHRTAGRFGCSGLRRVARGLNAVAGRRILLVQYVPPAFGFRAMNLPFCLWLLGRRLRGDEVRVMFHEVAFPFVRRPLKWNILAIVQRLMAAIVLLAASRVYVSAAAWIPYLRRLGLGRKPVIALPVPSNFPTVVPQPAVNAARNDIAPDDSPIAGHFGTYGPTITTLLTPILERLLKELPSLRVALIGRGGAAYLRAASAGRPEFERRVAAFDDLSQEEVAAHIQACDVMLQPFPDGASSRRTSLMACLATSVPVITTFGNLSEPDWQLQKICAATPVGDVAGTLAVVQRWLADPTLRATAGAQGANYYRAHFSLDRTIDLILDRTAATTVNVPPVESSALADR